MIVYARKAKEIRDRETIEATTHWGKELIQEPQPAKQEPQSAEPKKESVSYTHLTLPTNLFV